MIRTDRQTDEQTDKQTDRQKDRQKDRQTDRQTDGQTEVTFSSGALPQCATHVVCQCLLRVFPVSVLCVNHSVY